MDNYELTGEARRAMTTKVNTAIERLDLATMIRFTRRLALRMPNNAPSCTYAKPDPDSGIFVPECIIGHVFQSLGVDLADLCRAGQSATGIGHWHDRSQPMAAWLEHVQHRQDMGTNWADAVASADNEFPQLTMVGTTDG